jgi:hypothetical protein
MRLSLLLLSATFSIVPSVLAAPGLAPVATYDTGLGEQGAEIISIREADGIAALTNIAGSIDVLDLSNPAEPKRLRRILFPDEFGTPNSVAVHPVWDLLLAVSGSAGETGTVSAWRISDGTLLGSAPVGTQPDSIAIAPNGQYAVVANEAEGTGRNQDGGAGSLSVVELNLIDRRGDQPLVVRSVALPAQTGVPGFSEGRTDDLARLPIDNSPGTLEPETVAISADSRFAFVTLQENSAVARLEVRTGALAFFGLGRTAHAADLTADSTFNPVEELDLYREPDGIALTPDGRTFVTADEGDTRNGSGSSGPRGGRTVSVFDASSGALLGDTGGQLDAAAAAAGLYPDGRSNRGGSEPEVLDLVLDGGRILVGVGLERANAIALVDITVASAPEVVAVHPAGTAPEGVKFFRRGGKLYLAAANEVSGTVSLLQVTR